MKKYFVAIVMMLSCSIIWAQQVQVGELKISKDKITLPSGVDLKPDTTIKDTKGYYTISDTIVDVVNKIRLGDDVVKWNGRNKVKQSFSMKGYGYDEVLSVDIQSYADEENGLKELNFAEFQDSLIIIVGTCEWHLKAVPKKVLKKSRDFSLMDATFKYDTIGGFYYLDTTNGKKEFAFSYFEICDSVRLYKNNEEIPLQNIGGLYRLPQEVTISANDSVVFEAGGDKWMIYPCPDKDKRESVGQKGNTTDKYTYWWWLMLAGDVLAVLLILMWLFKIYKKHEKKKQARISLFREANDLLEKAGSIIQEKKAADSGVKKDDAELKRLKDRLEYFIEDKNVEEAQKAKEELNKYLIQQEEKTELFREAENLLKEVDSVIGKQQEEQSCAKGEVGKLKELRVYLKKYIEGKNEEGVRNAKKELEECLKLEEEREKLNQEIEKRMSTERDDVKKQTVNKIALLIEKTTGGVINKEVVQKEFEGESLSFVDEYMLKKIEKSASICPSTVGSLWSAASKESKDKSPALRLDLFVKKLDEEINKSPQQVQVPVWDENMRFSEVFDKLSPKQKNGFYTKVVQLLKEKKLKGKDDTLDNFIASLLEMQTKAESIKPDEDVVRNCVKNDCVPEDVKDELAKRFVAALNERIKDEPLRLNADINTLESLFVELLEKHIEVPHLEEELDKKAERMANERIKLVQEKLDAEIKKCSRLESQLGDKESSYNLAIKKKNEEIETIKRKATSDLDAARTTYQNNRRALEDKHEQELKLERKKLKDEQESHEKELDAERKKHANELDQQREEAKKAQTDAVRKISDEKVQMEQKFNIQITGLNNQLSDERSRHATDLTKLKEYCLDQVATINTTMALVTASVKEAIRESSSDGLNSLVNDSILDNDEIGMEAFFAHLKDVVNHSEVKSIGEFKEEIRQVLLQSFSPYRPTWIDILTRLFLYSKVKFVASQFVGKELDLCEVGAAFHAAEGLFKSFGVDLIYPELFGETFDARKYENRSLRDIDSYVEGLVTHIDRAEAIVDLYMVGYQVDGVLEKKPIVSSFS